MSVSLTKIPEGTARPSTVWAACSWCDQTATLEVTSHVTPSGRDWTDLTCERHAIEHFGASIPTRTPRCEICGGRGCNH